MNTDHAETCATGEGECESRLLQAEREGHLMDSVSWRMAPTQCETHPQCKDAFVLVGRPGPLHQSEVFEVVSFSTDCSLVGRGLAVRVGVGWLS